MPIFDWHVRLVPVPGSGDRLLAVMDDCGIDRAAVAAGGTIDLRRLSRQLVEGGHVVNDADNDAVLRVCEKSADRLVPVYFANPHRPARRYRERAAEFAGLEISPAVHGARLDDPVVGELVATAAGFGHSVYVVCLSQPGAAVSDLVALARRFPDVTFVLGHTGVGNIDFYGIDLVAGSPNVVVETSGGYTSVLSAAVEVLGPARVLFGSEFPLQHPSVELAKYAALDLPTETWRQIAWANAVRLLEPRGATGDAGIDPAAAVG